ncbi:LpqB family beta-propeller domain-containing protein [Brachybacterium hainanense]|uniref:LpqB family beta-propeller domain-containing protein n=1 Tax=Brachybacterium hainanense TaxID=1541174 RepID=A0ABV6RBX4_9MICO
MSRIGPLPPRRTLLRAAALAGTGLALGACARIPVSSPVEQRTLAGSAVLDAPYVQPLLPRDGATPEEIVLGFVQAGVGPEDDYAVARAYLAPGLRDTWNPEAAVTIYPAGMELQVMETTEGEVRLTVQAQAQVDARGIRTILGTASTRELDLQLEQVDGRWRIAAAPDGVFLSQAAFENLFTPARLYFVDPRGLHLVPDPRWFPLQENVQKLLTQLIAGPSEVLGAAVGSAVPDLGELAEAPVTVDPDGGTRLVLPEGVRALPEPQRTRALVQIQTSLRTLQGLSAVRVESDGELVDLAGQGLSRPLPGHRPIGAGPTGIISLADTTAGADAAQLVPALADVAVSAPAIGQSTPVAAALAADGSTLLLASTDGSVPRRDAAQGGRVIAPRVDDAGYVWTAPVANAGALLAVSSAASAFDASVDAPWLAGREVRGVDLSSDATRLVVLSADRAGTRLDLCAVVRSGKGEPTALTSPVALHAALEEIALVSWYDEAKLLLLGSAAAGEEPQVLVLDLMQGLETMPTPRPGTNRVAGSALSETIWATTSDGTLLRSTGSGWSPVDLPARDPAFY